MGGLRMLIRLALRNLARRPLRTGITVAAVGLSLALALLFVGLTEGSHRQMVDMAVRLQAGHVVIQSPGFQKERALEQRVTDPEGLLAMLEPLPADWRVSARILTTGLVRSSESSVMLDPLMGVDPENERAVSLVPGKIVRGSWLSPGQKGLLIGEKAAKRLLVDVGDKVVLSCSGLGQKVEERLEIVGIFRMGGETDRSLGIADRAFAGPFLGLGRSVHQVALFMPEGESGAASRKLRERLQGAAVEVLHWEEALPVLAQLLWIDSLSMYVFLLIIFGIAAAGILNAVLMSVMERTREFGILRSLGMPPRLVFALVMLENFLLALLCVGVGFAVGLPLVAWLAQNGLDPLVLTGGEVMEMEGVAFVDRMYPVLGASDAALAALWVVALSLASAVVPALRAAAIRPVRALRS